MSVRATRAYLWLLRLLPREFRERWGAEMTSAFLAKLASARGWGRVRVWARGVVDVLREAVVLRRQQSDGSRERRRGGSGLLGEVRLVMRGLRRRPGYVLAAVVVLGVGIGATTAVATVAEAVLALPYRDGERLVQVWTSVENDADRLPGLAAAAADALASSPGPLEDVGAYAGEALVLLEGDDPVRVSAQRVTPGLLPSLGGRPVRGRGFSATDAAAGEAVVLSERLTRRLFGDDEVIGRRVRFESATYTVVGVMPWSFEFPSRDVEAWLPLAEPVAGTSVRRVSVVARLREGVTLEDAQRQLEGLAAGLRDAGVFAAGMGFGLEGGWWFQAPASTRTILRLLLGAVILVLGIACANVAALAMRETLDRHADAVVRAALGASRARLVRERVLEMLLLGAAGGVTGMFLAVGLVRLAANMAPAQLRLPAGLEMFGPDPAVFGLAVACAFSAGLIAAVVPSLLVHRTDAAGVLRGGRGQSRGRRSRLGADILVASQVGLAMLLLVGAGLLVHSLVRLERVDWGYDAGGVTIASVRLPSSRYATPAARASFATSALDALRGLPEVASVTVGSAAPPLARARSTTTLETDAGTRLMDEATQFVPYNEVDGSWFDVLGIRLLAGRTFTPADAGRDDSPVILNEPMARRLWPDGDAVGRRIRLRDNESWRLVIGVVADTRQLGPDEPTGHPLEFYLPFTGGPLQEFLIRSRPGANIAMAIREQFRALDAALPVDRIASLDAELSATLGRRRFFFLVLGVFAAAAVLLAGVGIHGIVSWMVARRTREIGIRMALGAARGGVVGLILTRMMRVVLLGTAGGLLGAWALSRFLESQLYEVEPTDPLTYAAAALIFLMLACWAAWWPARRAAGVDPVRAIRAD